MADIDHDDSAERQPLLQRRLSSREDERLRFAEAQREAVGDVALSSGGHLAGICKLIVFFVMFGLLVLSSYIYIYTLWVIMFHLDKPCDQPLGPWLVGWIVLPTLLRMVDPPPQSHQSSNWHLRRMVFHSSWFAIGITWLAQCKTCQETNPDLYKWVHFVIHVYVVIVGYVVLAPIFIAMVFVLALRLFQFLIDHGWISNPKAASKDTVDNLEVVPYEPSLFADDEKDDRPSGECCCCCEAFGPGKAIVRTSCGHYYHKECLAEWLRLARTCPLCRCDLDEAAAGSLRKSGSPEEGAPRVVDVRGDEELARRLQEEEFHGSAFP
jgi:hypothetical protein